MMPTPPCQDTDCRRPDCRVALRLLAAGGAGALVLDFSVLAGCGAKPPDASVTVPLAELPPGKRLTIEVGDVPVELRRDGQRVVARSLLCTHQGCTVAWQEDIQQLQVPLPGGVVRHRRQGHRRADRQTPPRVPGHRHRGDRPGAATGTGVTRARAHLPGRVVTRQPTRLPTRPAADRTCTASIGPRRGSRRRAAPRTDPCAASPVPR